MIEGRANGSPRRTPREPYDTDVDEKTESGLSMARVVYNWRVKKVIGGYVGNRLLESQLAFQTPIGLC